MSDIWIWLTGNSNILMVILTCFTLIATIIIQIRIEKQRNEDIRARVHGSIVSDSLHTYLCLSNIGKLSAWNVRVCINEDFIDSLPYHMKNKDYLKILNERPIDIEPGERLYYLLHSTHLLENLCGDKLLTIRISGRYCNAYKINQVISINEFVNRPSYKLLFKDKAN